MQLSHSDITRCLLAMKYRVGSICYVLKASIFYSAYLTSLICYHLNRLGVLIILSTNIDPSLILISY